MFALTLTASIYSLKFVASSLTVTKAVSTVTENDLGKICGAALPTLAATLTEFANGDTASSSMVGAASLSTTATAKSAAGSYIPPVSHGKHGSSMVANLVRRPAERILSVKPKSGDGLLLLRHVTSRWWRHLVHFLLLRLLPNRKDRTSSCFECSQPPEEVPEEVVARCAFFRDSLFGVPITLPADFCPIGNPQHHEVSPGKIVCCESLSRICR